MGAFAVLGCVSYLLLQYALWCQPGLGEGGSVGTGSGPRALPGHVTGALTQPGAGRTACWPPFRDRGRGRQRFLLFLCALLALAIGMLGVGCAAVAAAILAISGISKWPVGSSAV